MRNGTLKMTLNYWVWKTKDFKRDWEANRRQNQGLWGASLKKVRRRNHAWRLEEKNQRYDWKTKEDDEGMNGNNWWWRQRENY